MWNCHTHSWIPFSWLLCGKLEGRISAFQQFPASLLQHHQYSNLILYKENADLEYYMYKLDCIGIHYSCHRHSFLHLLLITYMNKGITMCVLQAGVRTCLGVCVVWLIFWYLIFSCRYVTWIQRFHEAFCWIFQCPKWILLEPAHLQHVLQCQRMRTQLWTTQIFSCSLTVLTFLREIIAIETRKQAGYCWCVFCNCSVVSMNLPQQFTKFLQRGYSIVTYLYHSTLYHALSSNQQEHCRTYPSWSSLVLRNVPHFHPPAAVSVQQSWQQKHSRCTYSWRLPLFHGSLIWHTFQILNICS